MVAGYEHVSIARMLDTWGRQASPTATALPSCDGWTLLSVNDQNVLQTGNPAPSSDGSTLWDSGCQQKSTSIASYVGGNVTLRFSVHHYNDPAFHTWVYVDDVTVQ